MRQSALLLASILSASAIQFATPSIVFAQAGAPAIAEPEMNQFQFSAMVNADNVYVRSGPSENDYPVVKLNMSGMVIVVGNKFDWMKVLPPEGTYCLVGKAWIDKRGDGTVGRVRDDATNVNVRIGSTLNNMITKVAMQLKAGDDVQIIGEQDEYFKIAPPAGTFMYIHKKFVDPVKRVEVINDNGKLAVKPLDAPLPKTSDIKKTDEQTTVTDNTKTNETNTSNTTSTLEPAVAKTDNAGPSTQPSVQQATASESSFDSLEAKFEEASKLPLENQPIDELLVAYQKVVSDKQVPESMLRIAEFRVKGLSVRKDALAQYLSTKKMRTELAEKGKPVEVEGKEIEQKLVEAQVKQFTAVGTLRPSSLPYGGRVLYRLTDPTSSRTVIYVNTDDPNVIKYEGMFIGIKGDITEDTVRKIKFISPKSTDQLDPAEIVKGTATSNLLPASLMPSAASTGQ